VSVSHVAEDGGYDGVSAELAVTVRDDEGAPDPVEVGVEDLTVGDNTVEKALGVEYTLNLTEALPAAVRDGFCIAPPFDQTVTLTLTVAINDETDRRLAAERVREAAAPAGFEFPARLDVSPIVDIDLRIGDRAGAVYDNRDDPVRVCLGMSQDLRAAVGGQPVVLFRYDKNAQAWRALRNQRDEGARGSADTTRFSHFRLGFATAAEAEGLLARINRAILPEAARAMAASTVDAIRGRLEQAIGAARAARRRRSIGRAR